MVQSISSLTNTQSILLSYKKTPSAEENLANFALPDNEKNSLEHIAASLADQMTISTDNTNTQKRLQVSAGFLSTPQTNYDTHIIAQNDYVPAGNGAREEFMEFMAKSSDEKMFDLLLQKKGLTKEQLNALPPEERQKILDEIREEIERKVREKTGILESGADATSDL
jgi:hypothetical protein